MAWWAAAWTGPGKASMGAVAAVQAAVAAVTTRLVVRTGLTERRGRPLASDAGLPAGVGLDGRVAVALFCDPVVMSGCVNIHTPGDPAAEDRVAVQALAVLAGRARQVTEFLTAQASQPGLAAGQRTSVEARVRYLTNNQEYLRYDEALASGWPIAAGMVGIPGPPRARSPPPGPPPSHRLTEQVTTEELHPVHIDDFAPENLASSDTRP